MTLMRLLKNNRSNTPNIPTWGRISRDLFPFFRPEYLLIAGPQSLCFFSIIPGKKVNILSEVFVAEIDNQRFDDFLSQLRSDGYYFGQEITLLLPEPTTYTIIRRNDRTDLADLREECKGLARDEAIPKVRLVSIFGKQWYIVSGTDQEYAQKTLTYLSNKGFLVGNVMSLSGLILSNAVNTRGKSDLQTVVVELGMYKCCLNLEDGGSQFYYEELTNNNDSPGQNAGAMPLSYLLNTDNQNAQCAYYSARVNINTTASKSSNIPWKPLEKFLCVSSPGKDEADFSIKELIPTLIRHGIIAANSARLLMVVFIALIIVISVGAMTLSELKKTREEYYIMHQDKLADIYSLESQIAAVEKKVASLKTNYVTSPDFSAHLAIYCQKIPSNVYLTGIQCQRGSGGKLQVIAQGRAGRETSVFRYREYLAEYADNIGIEIKSISQLTRQSVGPDSLSYRFMIGTE